MRKDSKYPWYLLDIVVFLAFNIAILSVAKVDWETALSNINLVDLIVLGLGIYRLTDIITQEGVTDVIRAPYMDSEPDTDRGSGAVRWRISDNGFRGFFGTLFSCNSCMGVWVSAIVFYLLVFVGAPVLVFMVIMVLTGLERFLSRFENYLASRAGPNK